MNGTARRISPAPVQSVVYRREDLIHRDTAISVAIANGACGDIERLRGEMRLECCAGLLQGRSGVFLLKETRQALQVGTIDVGYRPKCET